MHLFCAWGNRWGWTDRRRDSNGSRYLEIALSGTLPLGVSSRETAERCAQTPARSVAHGRKLILRVFVCFFCAAADGQHAAVGDAEFSEQRERADAICGDERVREGEEAEQLQ